MFEKQTGKGQLMELSSNTTPSYNNSRTPTKALLILSIDKRKNLGSTGDVISENSFYC